jgi:hypothetical protein
MNWRSCPFITAFTLFVWVPSQAVDGPKLSRDEVIRLADAEASKGGFERKSYSAGVPNYNRDRAIWIVRYDEKVRENRAVASAVHFLIYVNDATRKASAFDSKVHEFPNRAYRPPPASTPLPSAVKATDDPSLMRFMTDKFTLVDRTEDIDSGVFALLKTKIGSRKRIAERDQAFLLSDVVPPGDDTLPDRRFVLAGHDDDIWFVKYVHGGFSPYGVLVVFLRTNGSWKIAFTAYGESEFETLDEIRRAITLGRYIRAGDWIY